MTLRQDLLEALDDTPLLEETLARRVYDFRDRKHRAAWLRAVHTALLELMREGLVQSVESRSGRALWYKED